MVRAGVVLGLEGGMVRNANTASEVILASDGVCGGDGSWVQEGVSAMAPSCWEGLCCLVAHGGAGVTDAG